MKQDSAQDTGLSGLSGLFNYFRGMPRHRLLLLAVLGVALVVQVVALVGVAQSQVQRAAARDAAERAAAVRNVNDSAPARGDALLADGVMTVGYAPVR